MKKKNRLLLIVIKLFITTVLICWIYTKINFTDLFEIIKSSHMLFFLPALIFHIMAFVFGSLRWWLLLRDTGTAVQYRAILPSYYLGLFFNNVLPAGIGGDVVRGYRLYQVGLSAKALTASSIIDRLIGVSVTVLAGVLALFYSDVFQLNGNELSIVLIAVCSSFIIGFVFFLPFWGVLIANYRKKYQHIAFARIFLDVLNLCHSYNTSKKLLIEAVVVTFLSYLCVVICYYFIGLAIDIDLPFIEYMFIVPLIFLVSNLPISLGGLGVREGVLISVLMILLVDEQKAIALSLIYLVILWLITLPASILFFTPVKKSMKQNGLT